MGAVRHSYAQIGTLGRCVYLHCSRTLTLSVAVGGPRLAAGAGMEWGSSHTALSMLAAPARVPAALNRAQVRCKALFNPCRLPPH